MVQLKYKIVLTASISCALTGCGWSEKLRLSSPSGRYRLELHQPPLLEQSDLRIDLVEQQTKRNTLYRAHHEIYVQFAHAYWAPDESAVGFVACGSGEIHFAYSLVLKHTLPFENLAGAMRKSLIASYGAPIGLGKLDPLDSACLVRPWVFEFVRRYPRASTGQ